LAFYRARCVLAALLRIGWRVKRTSGSHRTLNRDGWPDVVFAFHDHEEIGPRMPLKPRVIRAVDLTHSTLPDLLEELGSKALAAVHWLPPIMPRHAHC
jgi:predicted RNA binding protein YcfA (HicA-like mRNA interferase family)